MEKNGNTSGRCEKRPKLTLAGYYKNLPGPTAPKTDFVTRVAKRCKVGTETVRAWIRGTRKPINPKYEKILSEESGIPVENLWPNEAN